MISVSFGMEQVKFGMPIPIIPLSERSKNECSLKFHLRNAFDFPFLRCFSFHFHFYTASKVFKIYCLTKISIRAKRSISRVFSLFIVPSPFFVHCPYKGRINRAESVLTGLKPY